METKKFRCRQTKGKRKGTTFTDVQQINAAPHSIFKMIQRNRYFVFERFYIKFHDSDFFLCVYGNDSLIKIALDSTGCVTILLSCSFLHAKYYGFHAWLMTGTECSMRSFNPM